MLYCSLRLGTLSVQSVSYFDKTFHAAAHFVLCSWLFLLLDRKQHLKVITFSLFLGSFIENLQIFVPNRLSGIGDILANTVDALLVLKLTTVRRKP